ncbi:MAG: hypothetical protein KDJ47_02610 [Hyphomicrobiaceae bacterium]|nr:hypothetical protein [Hyphomicrobiaceae bacterium]
MIKEMIVGVVAVASTVGGSYLGRHLNQVPVHGGGKSEPEPVKHMKLEPISVPILRGGKLDGYVIARIAYAAPVKDADKQKDELEIFVNAATFRTFYADPAFDFAALTPVETQQLAGRIVKNANAQIGRETIKEVIIEGLNYMTPDEVRKIEHR